MHIHNDDEMVRVTLDLMKAQDDELKDTLGEAGYGSPGYLSQKINEATRWHQQYLDSMIDSMQKFILEILEKNNLIDMPNNYMPLSLEETNLFKADDKPTGWAEYLWNVLEQNGLTDKVLEQNDDLKKFIEEDLITSNVANVSHHVWQSFSKKPQSQSQVNEFFGKVYNEKFIDMASRHASIISAKMALTDVDALERAFKDGIAEGNGVYSVIDNLRDHPSFNPARSRAFALTEVLTSYAEGQQVALEQSKAIERKQWVHTGSHKNKPRPHHVALDGTEVAVDEYFNVGGHPALYPRDRNLPVEERVNCHCGVDPVVDLEEFGISEEDLENMRAEARGEIDEQFTVEELEQKIAENHQQFNNNPLDMGDIKFTTEVSNLTDASGRGIMEVEIEERSVGSLLAGVTEVGEPFRYNPEETYVPLKTDKSYDDYIEIRGINDFEHQSEHAKYFESIYGDWESKPRNSPIDHVIEAIRTYSGSKYWDINRYLRGIRSELKPELQKIADVLMDELEQNELADNMVLYRGVGPDVLQGKPVEVGAIITDPAFVSTSTTSKTARDFIDDSQGYLLKITSPKGTKALNISKYSVHQSEAEVLMQMGTAFKIDKIYKKSRYTVLEVTTVQSWRE